MLGFFLALIGGGLMYSKSDEVSKLILKDIEAQGEAFDTITNPDINVEARQKVLDDMPPQTKNMIAQTLIENGLMPEGSHGADINLETFGEWETIPEDNFEGEMDVDNGGFQKPEEKDTKEFERNANLVVGGVLLCVIFAPLLCMIGMVFFCCQLKSLSDHSETFTESCMGTILGCGIFPGIFAAATLFSIFSMILMVMLCAFFAEPWEMVELGNKMLKDETSTPIAKMHTVRGILTETSKMAWDGSICDDTYFARIIRKDEHDGEEPPPPQNGETLPRPKLCTTWLMAFRFGITSQFMACMCGFTGLLICFWVGYKSACANRRGVPPEAQIAGDI